MVCAPVRRDNPLAKARGLSLRTGAQTMLYLTCTTITSVDLAHYGIYRAKNWVSVNCGTSLFVHFRTNRAIQKHRHKITPGEQKQYLFRFLLISDEAKTNLYIMTTLIAKTSYRNNSKCFHPKTDW